jgi:hypothetical protein
MPLAARYRSTCGLAGQGIYRYHVAGAPVGEPFMPTTFAPMDISSHLDSPAMIAAYLREVLADPDNSALVVASALNDAAKAIIRLGIEIR